MLPAAFPEDIFCFQAADVVTLILNFGVSAQIDVRTVGYNRANNLPIARRLQRRIAAIRGVADAHLQHEVNAPAFFAAIDRTVRESWALTPVRSRPISMLASAPQSR